MNRLANAAEELSGLEELLCWIAGLAFTAALFWGLAHFENVRPEKLTPQIAEVRMVTMPFEPPPPPPVETPPPKPAEGMVAVSGIDVGRTDSPVHIAVVPPDLARLVPTTNVLPAKVVKFGYLDTSFKPRVSNGVNFNHVYQESQVDRPPRAIVRVAPPGVMRFFAANNIDSLRVVLLVVIDENGHVRDARVVKTSGMPEFDKLVIESLEEQWEFSPAIKKGKRVKCLAQQSILVTMGGSSPFET